jgi:hypothetical protein
MFSLQLGSYMGLIWQTASDIVNNLFGIYLIPVGLTLGLGLLALIVKAFKGAISIG